METFVIEVTLWDGNKIEGLINKINADARVLSVEVIA